MIYIGADHGGFQLKEKIKVWLKEWGVEFEDVGAKSLGPEDDYPEFAFAVAEKVGAQDDNVIPWKQAAKGILLCRSAAGMVIAANKVCGVRAVAVTDEKAARHSREHNNANVIGISGDWTDENQAQKILKVWLDTEFSKEARHRRRVGHIAMYETPMGCCGGGGEQCSHGAGLGCKCGGDHD